MWIWDFGRVWTVRCCFMGLFTVKCLESELSYRLENQRKRRSQDIYGHKHTYHTTTTNAHKNPNSPQSSPYTHPNAPNQATKPPLPPL